MENIFKYDLFIGKNTPELRKKLEGLGYWLLPNGYMEWHIPIDECPFLTTDRRGFYKGVMANWNGGTNMLTEKDYCDYETCVALKELGFDEKCHGYFEPTQHFNTTSIKRCWCNSGVNDIGVVICPTLYEAQKWLREEKKIHITIFSQSQESWQYRITKPHQKLEDGLHGEDFSSFEEALAEGIKEAVKILKEK